MTTEDLAAQVLAPGGPVARTLAARAEGKVDPGKGVPLASADRVPDATAMDAAGAPAFESRPEQVEMARAVAGVMDSRTAGAGRPTSGAATRLLVEAGTGVGKSFAYLVPSIIRCVKHHEKVVVATATISLQEQLMQKDIPLLLESLGSWDLGASAGGEELQPLVAVLAKGRGNYVSIRRLKLASSRQTALLPDAEQRHSLHVIEDWAYETQDGSLSTLPALPRPEVWDHVRSDTDNCMGRKCPHYQECFYQSARRAIEQANLIICNHALFFADLALRTQGVTGASAAGGAILPNYHHVVFDEAHNLEDAAAGYFGLSVSEPRVRRLLRTLYSVRRRKGYLAERALSIADSESVDRAIALVIAAEDASRRFFDQLLEFHRSGRSPSGRLRARDAEEIDNPLTKVMRDLATRLRLLRENVKSEPDRFELASLARRAQAIGDTCEALLAQSLRPPGDKPAGARAGAGSAEPRFVSDEEERGQDAASAGAFDDPESEERVREALSPYVYYIEVERDGGGSGDGAESSGRFGPRVTLACSPVDVAPLLRSALFDPAAALAELEVDEGGDVEEVGARPSAGRGAGSFFRPSIVLTSATLTTRTASKDEHPERAEAAFGHVMSTLGLPNPPTTRTLQLGSPFDYARQVELYVDLTMPSPRSGASAGGGRPGGSPASADRTYARALAQRIEQHVTATDGGAFVLFTSFAMLGATAAILRPRFESVGIDLFCQGADGSRSLVLKRFLESPRAVLFGAASFWQGVDVRGERLRNVIITRLPFEPPDRPVTQARLERIEALGGNPFAQDSLPRAIIRFKQGFGRLIRSKTDRGRVVVLDPRIATTSYGRSFLNALPAGVSVRTIEDPPDEFE